MDLRQFKLMNKAGLISEVHLRDQGNGYSVWFAFQIGGQMEPLELTRPNPEIHGLPERSWQDLNRALAFVRRHGWTGPVVVCTD